MSETLIAKTTKGTGAGSFQSERHTAEYVVSPRHLADKKQDLSSIDRRPKQLPATTASFFLAKWINPKMNTL